MRLQKIPGVQFSHPEGAFYLMVTLPVDDEKLQYFLLQEFEDHGETVMYAPRARGFYATPGKGRSEIRIAYVTAAEKLRRAVEVLATAFKPITHKTAAEKLLALRQESAGRVASCRAVEKPVSGLPEGLCTGKGIDSPLFWAIWIRETKSFI